MTFCFDTSLIKDKLRISVWKLTVLICLPSKLALGHICIEHMYTQSPVQASRRLYTHTGHL